MNVQVELIDILVGGALLAACYTDLTRWKIPNSLTVTLWPLGIGWFIVGALAGQPDPWWTGLLGFAVAFPLHMAFWMVGLDKGGDAKMMIGFGACYGWAFMVEATLWSLLLMGPVGLVVLTVTGKLPSLLASFRYVGRLVYNRLMKLAPPEAPEQTYLPKAPVLLTAWLAAFLTNWLDLA